MPTLAAQNAEFRTAFSLIQFSPQIHIGGSVRGYLAAGGASQQFRYGLLTARLFCIFIYRHPWGD
jgi:hypothetical protein